MKWMTSLLVLMVVLAVPRVRAQDPATEERLNKLAGQIEDLRAAQEALSKEISRLNTQISHLREQLDRPTPNYASQDDLKRVADAVKEVDRKRMDDYEKIGTQLRALSKALSASGPAPGGRKPSAAATPERERDSGGRDHGNAEEKGFEYTVKSGDSLSLIVQAYRDQNIKVTAEQVLKANPGLKPEKLRVGQKIWIPAPGQ
jgi:LysM repeat protein